MKLITDPVIKSLVTEINKILSLVFPKEKFLLQVELRSDDVYENFPCLVVSLKQGECFVVGSKVKLVPIPHWTEEEEEKYEGVNPSQWDQWDKTWETIELFHWCKYNYWSYFACTQGQQYVARQVAMRIIGSVIDANLSEATPLLAVRAITKIGVKP